MGGTQYLLSWIQVINISKGDFSLRLAGISGIYMKKILKINVISY